MRIVEPKKPLNPKAIEHGRPGNIEFFSNNLIVITKPIKIPIIVNVAQIIGKQGRKYFTLNG